MTIRERISQLPLLETSSLNSHEELLLAHKVLSFAASTYVWLHGKGGEPEVSKVWDLILVVARNWLIMVELFYFQM
ncbi:hypothetical protein AHF37_12337 [Paragonimus kellicotti]|nr:hypothetical protein AHF37_12337 [Paragonimus kellicotti]